LTIAIFIGALFIKKKEEGRRKKEEGRREKDEGRSNTKYWFYNSIYSSVRAVGIRLYSLTFYSSNNERSITPSRRSNRSIQALRTGESLRVSGQIKRLKPPSITGDITCAFCYLYHILVELLQKKEEARRKKEYSSPK
jgi:hypothetical protein